MAPCPLRPLFRFNSATTQACGRRAHKVGISTLDSADGIRSGTRTGSNADPDSNGESAAASTGHHGARADGGVGANIGVLAARAPSVAAGGLDDEGRAGVSFGVRVGLAGGRCGNGDGDVDGDRHDCARRTETNEKWRRLQLRFRLAPRLLRLRPRLRLRMRPWRSQSLLQCRPERRFISGFHVPEPSRRAPRQCPRWRERESRRPSMETTRKTVESLLLGQRTDLGCRARLRVTE